MEIRPIHTFVSGGCAWRIVGVAVLHHICPAVLTSVVCWGGVEGQAVCSRATWLDPGVVVGIILTISPLLIWLLLVFV